jgi:hypothetical protein
MTLPERSARKVLARTMVARSMLRIRLFLLTLALAVGGLAPATASARTGVLPDPTYDAIVGAYQAIEALAPDENATTLPKNYFASVRSACKKIPSTDDLLRSFRATCLETYVLVEALAKPCTTKRSCLRQLEKSAASAGRMYKLGVAENRIVARTVPAGPCRKTLSSTSKELKDVRELGRVLTSLARALETGNERASLKASKRLDAIMERWTAGDDDPVTALSTHC